MALEYRKVGRAADALRVFTELRAQEPSCLPMYLMAGQLLLEMEAPGQARFWLEQGLKLAQEKGDTKAASEIDQALAMCEQ